MHVSTRRARRHRQMRFKQILPPIQLGTTGQPISIVDSVTRAVVLAVVLSFIAWVVVGKMSPDAVV